MWTLGRQNVDTGTSKGGHWDVRMWTLGFQNVDTEFLLRSNALARAFDQK